MIKKGEIITILALLLFVYITDSAKAVINDVQITPDEPTTKDIITVVTFGTENQGDVTVIDSVVNITETHIGLDITLITGDLFVMTDWSYSVDIGRLSAGTYELIVRTIVNSFLTDAYFKTFQVSAIPLDGSGTEQDPWRIKSLEDFNEFAADANYWDDYTRLETDVNLAGRTYTTAVIASLGGVFDGNDHKIFGLTVNDGGVGNDDMGLFGSIVEDGQVSNLCLEGCVISGRTKLGGLVGVNHGGISNCYSTGFMNGVDSVGGLVGFNYGSISDCYSTGDVNGHSNVGGLVGSNFFDGKISNCYSIGSVNGGHYYIGGLVGDNAGEISNCYSTGDVTGHYYVGGLAGENYGSPMFGLGSNSNCHSTGTVNGDRYVGGLVGASRGNISNCCSTGDVNGVVTVGGLVGYTLNFGREISNSYSTGDVSGNIEVGGLVGHNEVRILKCYSTGDVNGLSNIGGLVGINMSSMSVTNCFWDTETSGQSTSAGGTGKTTTEMKKITTFTDWDFINIWNIGENQTYPYLRVYLPSDINKDGIVNFLDVAITANQWMEEQ